MSEFMVAALERGSTNYSLSANSGPPLVLVNTVLLKHSHIHLHLAVAAFTLQ